MIRDIDIGLIRAFIAVAETGGMTKAAQVLNLTQGAVSQKIKRLEELFNNPLFERHNKSLTLNPTGERLLSHAYRMVSLNDETWHLMTQPEYSGEIRLGVPPDIVRPFMPAILKAFNQEHPRILVTLVSNATPLLLEQLRNHELDLTLTTETLRGKKNELLLNDSLVWVGAANGNACYRKPIPVSLGSKSCAFRAPALEALTNARIEWQSCCHEGLLESILTTLEADIAVAPYLSKVIPDGLAPVEEAIGLPALPECYINLRLPKTGNSLITEALAEHIRKWFANWARNS